MNFNFGHFWVIFGQNTKVIALLFGQKWLNLITFQSAIKMNEFQLWSCVVLETIVMIFRPQKVSNSIHRVGNKRKERKSYTVMSDNASNKKMCALR